MFDLDMAVASWRNGLGRRSSLSPRELDELEDHLRAHFELELELNAALAPARAFAIARAELGEASLLSTEFGKARRRQWKRLLVAGWALFAVSFLLPAVSEPVFASTDGLILSVPGWDAFLSALSGMAGPLGLASACTNGLMLVAGLWLGRKRLRHLRQAAVLMAAVAALNLVFWPLWVVIEGGMTLQAGYFAWAGSFACAATALWLRARQWASAQVSRVSV